MDTKRILRLMASTALFLPLLFTSCKEEDETNKDTQVSKVELNLHEKEALAGDVFSLKAMISPLNATNQEVIWYSDDELVAEVTNGKVKIISRGSAFIYVKTLDGGFSDSCHVIPGLIKVDKVDLNIHEKQLFVNESFTLTAATTPDDADDKTILWSSADESIAKVTDGKVEILSKGTTYIYAKSADGNAKDSCKMTAVVDEKKVMLDLVNELRNNLGVGPITLDSALCEAAEVRLKELPELFSHTRPDGSSCFTVLDDLGIRCTSCAENIAQGQNNTTRAFTSWKNSEGHYKNMTNEKYTKMGFAYDLTHKYWIQLFIK